MYYYFLATKETEESHLNNMLPHIHTTDDNRIPTLQIPLTASLPSVDICRELQQAPFVYSNWLLGQKSLLASHFHPNHRMLGMQGILLQIKNKRTIINNFFFN